MKVWVGVVHDKTIIMTNAFAEGGDLTTHSKQFEVGREPEWVKEVWAFAQMYGTKKQARWEFVEMDIPQRYADKLMEKESEDAIHEN